MKIWQVDFYRSPVEEKSGQVLWELLICDSSRSFEYVATCPQSTANSDWLATQIQLAAGDKLPDVIQVFRPQCLSLIQAAASKLNLNIVVEPTRNTQALKQWLAEKQYPLALDKPPPTPLPENLWGEQWRFATLPAGELLEVFADLPIPVFSVPECLQPINLGLPSTALVPGVVIYGGRQSMILARWLESVHPVALNYISGANHGLVLEAGLVDRWIVATFTDADVVTAARVYQQRQQQSTGLHFLLVQPDDSGMTYSGFWLLRG